MVPSGRTEIPHKKKVVGGGEFREGLGGGNCQSESASMTPWDYKPNSRNLFGEGPGGGLAEGGGGGACIQN